MSLLKANSFSGIDISHMGRRLNNHRFCFVGWTRLPKKRFSERRIDWMSGTSQIDSFSVGLNKLYWLAAFAFPRLTLVTCFISFAQLTPDDPTWLPRFTPVSYSLACSCFDFWLVYYDAYCSSVVKSKRFFSVSRSHRKLSNTTFFCLACMT